MNGKNENVEMIIIYRIECQTNQITITSSVTDNLMVCIGLYYIYTFFLAFFWGDERRERTNALMYE